MAPKDVKGKATASESEHEHGGTPDYSTDEYPDPSPAPTSANPKKDKAGRVVKPRPKKRTLVRWNETLDQRALLAVQHVCSQEGIKIPWAKVGTLLDSRITEGALVQHLAKLRTRLKDDGVEVTPPLKRGGKAANSKQENTKTVTHKGAVAKRTSKPKAPAKGNQNDAVDDSDHDYDSDGERIGKKHNARPKKERTVGKKKPSTKGTSGSVKVKVESGDSSGSKSSIKKANNPVKAEPREEDTEDDEAIVAVGAPFLAQEWSGESSISSGSTENPSKVVALPIGQINAQLIEAWQNDEEDDEGAAPEVSNEPQLNDVAMGSNLLFGDNAEMLFDQGDFNANNLDFGNNRNQGFDLNPFGANFSQAANFSSFSPAQGGPQYGAANNNSGTTSMGNYFPNQAFSNNMSGQGFGNDFGAFGNPYQGMGYSANPFAAPGNNPGYFDSAENTLSGFPPNNYEGQATNNTPKDKDRNADKGGFGAASSSQAQQGRVSRNGRRKEASGQNTIKQEKPANSAGQSQGGSATMAATSASFNPSLSAYGQSGENGFNEANQTGVEDWLNNDIDWNEYLDDFNGNLGAGL